MSNYLPLVNKTYHFEGDAIEVSFSLLTRKQMMDLLPLMPKEGEEATMEEQTKLMDIGISTLKENIVSFSGLKDGNGRALEFEEAVEKAYFSNLMTDILTDMYSESILDDGDEKK